MRLMCIVALQLMLFLWIMLEESLVKRSSDGINKKEDGNLSHRTAIKTL